MLASEAALERELTLLGQDGYCHRFVDTLSSLRSLLLPPENISTTECAAQYRYLKNMEGAGKRLWSLDRTPYMRGPHDALDDPKVRMVIVVGPERSGKSVGGENHLFKRLRNGPLTDTIIYLQPGPSVDSYADKEFSDLIELHPDIQRGLGPRPSDRKNKSKRIKGRVVQVLPANDGNLRQREAPFIIATEVDGYGRIAGKAVQEIKGRLKSFGAQAKGYVESHPDLGWDGAVAPAWKEGSQGVLYMPCPHCGGWSTPHQLAPKGMRLTLNYTRDDTLDANARADKAAETAAALCPYSGCLIDDAERYGMIDQAQWCHQDQVCDAFDGVQGEAASSETMSFWLHGLNVKRPLRDLAREHLAATLHFERTRKPERIKRFFVKSLGEVYEGAAGRALDPATMVEAASTSGFEVGTIPKGVIFLTGAVDVGGSKFDVGIWGWDLEGRSWLIDRFTIVTRRWADGRERQIKPGERQDDWNVIRDQVLNMVVPFADNPDMGLPLAGVAVDTGGVGFRDANDVVSGVTWKAREFARRMARAKFLWGKWHKVRLIKGAKLPSAPELPNKGRTVNVDEQGRAVEPPLLEWDLGVHRLKNLAAERLAVDDGGPGQCYFANGLPRSTFDELTGETLIDGKWVRRGANETLDLFGYAEGVRQMLKPDRQDIDWNKKPVWAQAVPVGDAEPEKPGTTLTAPKAAKQKSIFDRFAELNKE
jgi:phage terminase large subunit GpA-like protein